VQPSLTRVNPFFSNEKPGRRSTSGDFGIFISKSLARANSPQGLVPRQTLFSHCEWGQQTPAPG